MEMRHLKPAPTPEDATGLRVPMRDGVELAADLYRPAHGRPAPTILIRTPYNKAMGAPLWDLPAIARIFVSHGYAVVAQDVRGKFLSGGATEPYKNEIDDGYDTIDWIVQQPWCDGNIGMWGTSYFGFTQLAAVASGHPALKCIVPRMTGTELGFPMENPDGARDVEHAVFRWYFGQVYVVRDMYMFPLDWSKRPLTSIFEPFYEHLGQRSTQMDASFEPEFFDRVIPRERLLANPTPTLFTVGIYDMAAVWSWRDIDAIQAHPAWNGLLHLRIEAIDHEGYSLALAPMDDTKDHRLNPAAREKLEREIVDPTIPFFNKYLRGIGEGVPKVVYHFGADEWRTSETWPPLPSQTLRLHLDGDGPAAAGTLSLEPVKRRVARWRHDPDNPVRSIAVTEMAPCGPGVRSIFQEWADLAPVGERDDVLAFASAPLEGDLELAGPVSLACMLSSTLRSADLFARLLDLAPDGTAGLICRGHVRVPLEPVAEDASDGGLLARGRAVTVPLIHASSRVRAGHRLLLHIFGSDFPEYLFNPGDGSETWLAEHALAGTHGIEIGGLRGAALTITAGGTPAAIRDAFAVKGPAA
ncbi:hypothetical protein BV96_02129 [Sphingomonas paucimobilis]|nr:hypothetical protein BV96_02129 [Sphingomonas paucimobilis]